MFIHPVCNSLHLSYCFFFNWKIIALQYYIGFCRASAGISHKYTYVPSPLNLPPTSHHILPLPLHCHKRTGYEPSGHTAHSHWLAISHPVMFMCQRCSPGASHPLLPYCVHRSVHYGCMPTASMHRASSIPSSRFRIYMCVNIYLFFSFHRAFLKCPHHL